MCGITGIFDTRARRDVPREILVAMNDAVAHRGPDDDGFHFEAGVGLGHRRLSIIDLSTGHQPIYNEDRTVAVVFNGEIYNYQDLVAELSAKGHVFQTKSDTECIVHAWEEWGEACVNRFRGMFAFGLWDRNRETLFLARDRLGVKPMYYTILPDGMLLFGSELKALLAHPRLSRVIEPQTVEEYFALGYVPEPRTVFKDVYKLPPAHTLAIRRGQSIPASREYWDVRFDVAPASLGDEEACEELVVRLRESVRLRMIADVPLGAFLSGGVDSSAVVAMMAGLSSGPVNTCSIGFNEAKYDESIYAAQVAERYRTDHRVEHVESDDFDLIDTLARLYDEPYADSSAIPTYRVCQLARKNVTVALSGDGGDETFGGYRRYRFHLMEEKLRSSFPLGMRKPVFGALGRAYPKADWAPRVLRAKSTFEALGRDSVEAYFHTMSLIRSPLRQSLYSPAFRRELAGYDAIEVMRRHAQRAPTDDALAQIQYIDLKTYLVGDINTKVDRAAMAHSLEVREPLMDHPLVEWMATLPSSLKIRNGEQKWLLKKAMEPYLPSEIMYRPKMGFSIPLAQWFRGPLAERVRTSLLGSRLADTGWFDRDAMKRIVEQHQSGARDHSTPIWTILMFDAFLKNVVEGSGDGSAGVAFGATDATPLAMKAA